MNKTIEHTLIDWEYARKKAGYSTMQEFAAEVSDMVGYEVKRQSIYGYWKHPDKMPDDVWWALMILIGRFLPQTFDRFASHN